MVASGWWLIDPIPLLIWMGIAYSLGAASMWPIVSVAVPPKLVGTAYGAMSSIQVLYYATTNNNNNITYNNNHNNITYNNNNNNNLSNNNNNNISNNNIFQRLLLSIWVKVG